MYEPFKRDQSFRDEPRDAGEATEKRYGHRDRRPLVSQIPAHDIPQLLSSVNLDDSMRRMTKATLNDSAGLSFCGFSTVVLTLRSFPQR